MYRRSRARRIAALTILGLALPAVIEAIYVAPTAVFIDDRTRFAEVTIGNSGDRPEEATVELQFGFPDTDAAGTPYVRFVPDAGPEYPSAAEWIRPFPQRVRLDPGTQQVVRLLARPPADLPEGEYWARMIITGRGAYVRLPTADTTLHAGVNVEIRLVVSVTYRKGNVTTRPVIRSITAEAEGDSLTVWAHLAREGNAAFLGTADVEVVDLRGTILRSRSVGLAVHYPVRRRFSYPLDSLPPGDYRVRFRLRAERSDLPAERVLRAPPAVDSVGLRIE
jgi:hypothetical protein